MSISDFQVNKHSLLPNKMQQLVKVPMHVMKTSVNEWINELIYQIKWKNPLTEWINKWNKPNWLNEVNESTK